eukprot:gnl/TRDRNA2_/TRDRNA2_186370_c0_seq1.p1 gnl/TRDRNA2_/TRDRNA2_186370_c0~~gnl/TRDRNA2_/TRDRNA2_186370_c0_seq1.p1  ORF type:complete len:239 (+),score=75.87 gnl/TRDRNA2_/TRDRNA2_186370_c0_seq1:50-718(+)
MGDIGRTRRQRGAAGPSQGRMSGRPQRRRALIAFATSLLATAPICVQGMFGGGGAKSPKDSPAMTMLQCDSCRAVLEELAKDVKYLVESEKMWKEKDLEERLKISCQDPSLPTGAMRDACGYMMADYHKQIAKEVALRWNEDSDEFEEDIVPRDFCTKVGVCKQGHKTINQMIGESEKKEKQKKEQEEDKAATAKRKAKQGAKKQKAAAATADDDDDDDDDL